MQDCTGESGRNTVFGDGFVVFVAGLVARLGVLPDDDVFRLNRVNVAKDLDLESPEEHRVLATFSLPDLEEQNPPSRRECLPRKRKPASPWSGSRVPAGDLI